MFVTSQFPLHTPRVRARARRSPRVIAFGACLAYLSSHAVSTTSAAASPAATSAVAPAPARTPAPEAQPSPEDGSTPTLEAPAASPPESSPPPGEGVRETSPPPQAPALDARPSSTTMTLRTLGPPILHQAWPDPDTPRAEPFYYARPVTYNKGTGMIVGGSVALIPGVVLLGMGLGWNFAPLSVPGAVITAGGGTLLGLGIHRRIRWKQGRARRPTRAHGLRLGVLPTTPGAAPPRPTSPTPSAGEGASPAAAPSPARRSRPPADLRKSTALVTSGAILMAGVATPTLMSIIAWDGVPLKAPLGSLSAATGAVLIGVGLFQRRRWSRARAPNPAWPYDAWTRGNGTRLTLAGGLTVGVAAVPMLALGGLWLDAQEDGGLGLTVGGGLALAGGVTMLSIGSHRRTRAKYLDGDTAGLSSESTPNTSPTFSLHGGAVAPMSIRPGVAYGRPVRTYGFQLSF